MCGGDDSCGYFVANILYVSERLASCCAATAVVVCLVVTLLIMLGLGVGLGYNYCVIDTKLLPMPKDVVEDDDTATSSSTTEAAATGRRRRRAFAPAALQAPVPGQVTQVTQVTPAAPMRTHFHSLLATLTDNSKNLPL